MTLISLAALASFAFGTQAAPGEALHNYAALASFAFGTQAARREASLCVGRLAVFKPPFDKASFSPLLRDVVRRVI